jgi:hypothetical protein
MVTLKVLLFTPTVLVVGIHFWPEKASCRQKSGVFSGSFKNVARKIE